MGQFALKVVHDIDAPERFRWQLLEDEERAQGRHRVHQLSDKAFDSYADALNAGAVALARADQESYENEAADPVGEPARPAASSGSVQSQYVSHSNPRALSTGAQEVRPAQTSNRYGGRQTGRTPGR